MLFRIRKGVRCIALPNVRASSPCGGTFPEKIWHCSMKNNKHARHVNHCIIVHNPKILWLLSGVGSIVCVHRLKSRDTRTVLAPTLLRGYTTCTRWLRTRLRAHVSNPWSKAHFILLHGFYTVITYFIYFFCERVTFTYFFRKGLTVYITLKRGVVD